MGEPRFNTLSSKLPEDVSILGLDEHTACIIDLEKEAITIRGLGCVTLQRKGVELTFSKGERYPLAIFRGEDSGNKFQVSTSAHPDRSEKTPRSEDDSFWEKIHRVQFNFQASLDANDSEKATNALLELDGTIWKGQQELENPEFISQARDILRDMIVLFGTTVAGAPGNTSDSLDPVVEQLINIRNQFRQTKKWAEADAIRDCLMKANIVVEDTDDGSRWHVNK